MSTLLPIVTDTLDAHQPNMTTHRGEVPACRCGWVPTGEATQAMHQALELEDTLAQLRDARPVRFDVLRDLTDQYRAWADTLIDRVHELANERQDRHLRAILLDLSDNLHRAWTVTRTVRHDVDELRQYQAATERKAAGS